MKKKYDLSTPIDKNGKILIGIPRERLYIPLFVDGRDKILMTLQKAGRAIGYYQHEGSRVDRNRDEIVDHFLEHPEKPEWLQFLDSDMDHPSDISLRLSKWGKPIVGGLYFHRGKEHMPFAFKESKDDLDKYGRMVKWWTPMRDEVYQFLQENRVPYGDGAINVDEPLDSPLVEVDAVATGMLLIHRSVLEIMDKPIFEFIGQGTGEDMMFCWKAKHEHGIPIYCDFSTIGGHYIFSPQGQTQFRQVYERRGLNFASYTKREAIEMYAKFMGISFDVAQDKINSGSVKMVNEYWEGKFGDNEPTPEEVLEFYKDPYVGRLYLIELLHWNFSPTFYQIKHMFTTLRNLKVLEIGSGIGTLAVQLAIQKCDYTGAEINDVLRKFSEMRVNDVREKVTSEMAEARFVSDEWRDAPDDTYDAIVSTDVFEHMTAEELQRTLKDMARVIKPNGNLMYHANFGQQELYPMHYDHSEMWDTWLIQAGFLPMSNTHAVRGYGDGLDS